MKLFSFVILAITAQRKKPKDDYGSPLPVKPYEEAYGDPHFMVSSIGEPPICFDYNPPPNSDIMLLTDPESSLLVRGTLSDVQHGNKTFIEQISFMSPGGAQLTFNPDGVHLKGLPVRQFFQEEDEETVRYGDIIFTEKWNDDGTRA